MASDTSGICDLCGKEADPRYEVQKQQLDPPASLIKLLLCWLAHGMPVCAPVSTLQDCHVMYCTANCHREEGDIYHADCLKKVSTGGLQCRALA